MAEVSFAKLDKLPPLPLGKVFSKPGSSSMFRVIGPNNEVERFTGNRAERAETAKLWARQMVTQSRFAGLVDWPQTFAAPIGYVPAANDAAERGEPFSLEHWYALSDDDKVAYANREARDMAAAEL